MALVRPAATAEDADSHIHHLEAYLTIPHNSSNKSILSNENRDVREASLGQRRWVVVAVSIVLGALVTFCLLAVWFLALPKAKDTGVSSKHHQAFEKHLRVVRAQHEREESAELPVVVVNSTSRTSTLTTSQTSTTTTTPYTYPDPTLFCFAIMRADDTEIALMREQLAKGASIYGCDDWAVFSDTKTWLSLGPPVRLESTVVDELTTSGHANGNKEHNALQFLSVWDKVREDGRYKDSNWVVKVDPDTVFFPERLKANLQRAKREPSDPALFANCRAEGHPHFMFGAIEVFSKATLEAFFKDGDRCKKELKAEQMWEERYMSHCLRLLKVPMVQDFDLLQDFHCDFGEPTVPCTADAVAFHPLRTPAEYNACQEQAEAHWEELQSKTEKKDEKKQALGEEDEAHGRGSQHSQAKDEDAATKEAKASSHSRVEGKDVDSAKNIPEQRSEKEEVEEPDRLSEGDAVPVSLKE